ncbi:hypothetical protein BO86DRAFT_164588 [Aspergillus japonicus CBS 114.51]|uniref:Uncharacterized protein n=1 Tax=Aspergillus japonicus CBS 114.51 TaxID=1448312 RepID=A0A8T8XCF9_ASPJA|nr:hypothetical protein BO86DRAFT_164588 [Aspergillus japonicus CBS 114.51]RAH85710.1 hypothetical protein BO86DRAFT_164588 [Aspergillus japonicus CBS 114.51]
MSTLIRTTCKAMQSGLAISKTWGQIFELVFGRIVEQGSGLSCSSHTRYSKHDLCPLLYCLYLAPLISSHPTVSIDLSNLFLIYLRVTVQCACGLHNPPRRRLSPISQSRPTTPMTNFGEIGNNSIWQVHQRRCTYSILYSTPYVGEYSTCTRRGTSPTRWESMRRSSILVESQIRDAVGLD